MNIEEYINHQQKCKKQPHIKEKGLEEFHETVAKILSNESKKNYNRLDLENYSEQKAHAPVAMIPFIL